MAATELSNTEAMKQAEERVFRSALVVYLFLVLGSTGWLLSFFIIDETSFRASNLLFLLWVLAPHLLICWAALLCLNYPESYKWFIVPVLFGESTFLFWAYGSVNSDANGALAFIFLPLWHWLLVIMMFALVAGAGRALKPAGSE